MTKYLREPIMEKKLTKAEKDKKEDIIMSMKKKKGGKDKLTDKDYAIATSTAKKVAENKLTELIKTALKGPVKESPVEDSLTERIFKKLREGKEERTSTVSKARAKAEVKDIENGKRSDGMGKPTAKVYAVKDGKEIELKTLKDFNKHSSGYTYKLK